MFSDPHKNLEQFDLLPGMQVADLGSGAGFYAIPLAQIVGDKGKVYAIDVQKDLLAKLQNEAKRVHLHNINIIWGDLEEVNGTKLKDQSVDRVIAINIIFQIENVRKFISEIDRIVKPHGQVLVIDWQESFGGTGPQKKDIAPKNDVRTSFELSGLAFVKEIRAGAHHYGMIFKKP